MNWPREWKKAATFWRKRNRENECNLKLAYAKISALELKRYHRDFFSINPGWRAEWRRLKALERKLKDDELTRIQ